MSFFFQIFYILFYKGSFHQILECQENYFLNPFTPMLPPLQRLQLLHFVDWVSHFKSASSSLFWRSVLARLSLRVSARIACCFLNKTSVSAYFNFTRAASTWARFQVSSTKLDWEIAADLSEDAFCFKTMSGFNTFFGSMTHNPGIFFTVLTQFSKLNHLLDVRW